ncbi:hypothetical protein AGDE_12555 [Angomonas deanei]|uniref:Uncharacterized protein n=1 Tax=Angomonas deanei TaxID=59799 RepID=A0A7G2CG90_9TRYP|nr:hypothetical protein AGDE_12555 [Angomonas deanei]CAD2217202.1 hypothetical protein, conserved [Angomonas deanei]|eukprot:EPY24040.1 hypothetical protein AGDE_12555 [Angomonas deanei]
MSENNRKSSSNTSGGDQSNNNTLYVKVLEMCAQNPKSSTTHRRLANVYELLKGVVRSLSGEEGFQKDLNELFGRFCISSLSCLADLEEAVFAYVHPDKVTLNSNGAIEAKEEVPFIEDMDFFRQICRYLSNVSNGVVKALYLENIAQNALKKHNKEKNEATAPPPSTTAAQKKRKREEISTAKAEEVHTGPTKMQVPWSLLTPQRRISFNRDNLMETIQNVRRKRKEGAPTEEEDDSVIVSDFFKESLTPFELLLLWEKREKQINPEGTSEVNWISAAEEAPVVPPSPSQTEAPIDKGETKEEADSSKMALFPPKGSVQAAVAPMLFVSSMQQFGVSHVKWLYGELE